MFSINCLKIKTLILVILVRTQLENEKLYFRFLFVVIFIGLALIEASRIKIKDELMLKVFFGKRSFRIRRFLISLSISLFNARNTEER